MKTRTVLYAGQHISLQRLSEITGIKYITLYRRLRSGRDLLQPLRTERPKCTARSVQECFNCPFPDCIRPDDDFLDDEIGSAWL